MDDQPIRVIIADDHPVARKGVLSLLSASRRVEVLAEASNGAEVLALYPKLRPSVVISDLRMPVLDGVGLTRALLAFDPKASVLIFTHHDGDEQVLQALRAGARGYLTKDAEGEQLLLAITELARGGRFIPAELAGRYVDLLSRPTLSPRERETLHLVARGMTNQEIAKQLGLTERTAAMHVGNVLSKLGAKTRTEAVGIATRSGLLEFD